MTDVRRLPRPVAESWSWQLRAACRDLDSDVFFHPERERGSTRAAREAMAKRVCRGCPVVDDCLRHALTAAEHYGVWGGLSTAERDAILAAAVDHEHVRGSLPQVAGR